MRRHSGSLSSPPPNSHPRGPELVKTSARASRTCQTRPELRNDPRPRVDHVHRLQTRFSSLDTRIDSQWDIGPPKTLKEPPNQQ